MTTSAEHEPHHGEDLQQQAWDWLQRLRSLQVSTQDADAFKAWLATSPAHADAYRAARQRWSRFKPLAGELLRTDPETAAYHARTMRRPSGPSMGRRAFLGAAVGGVAAAAAVAVIHPPAGLWPALREWDADLRTGTGEQQAVTLAGQIQLTLNTRTSIRHHAEQDGGAAGIDLLEGEAAVDLPGGGSRPFLVAAGAGVSRSTSGRFEVRYLDGKVCVTCIDGELSVEHPGGTRRLRAREQVIYVDDALGNVVVADPARVSAWRRGELVFEQARLDEVIAEINRYRPGRVILRNDSVRAQRVSGIFLIASLDQALSQLQHTFDLSARKLVGGYLLLS